MNARLAVGTVLLVATLACGSQWAPESDSDTTWVGTITTEGNVTTVVNESGSVWGGVASLVKEIRNMRVDVFGPGRRTPLDRLETRPWVL